jgi:integrase
VGLGKQAKILNKHQIEALILFLDKRPNSTRNRVIVLLSTKAGLRAKEIAMLTWGMVQDTNGAIADRLELHNSASKGVSGRLIPVSRDLKSALQHLLIERGFVTPRCRIVQTARTAKTTPQVIVNLFQNWYQKLGYQGCSSHSGRRTFITNAARKISSVGGSLKDVQSLAGHSSLSTTQRYIEINAEAKRRVVELV